MGKNRVWKRLEMSLATLLAISALFFFVSEQRQTTSAMFRLQAGISKQMDDMKQRSLNLEPFSENDQLLDRELRKDRPNDPSAMRRLEQAVSATLASFRREKFRDEKQGSSGNAKASRKEKLGAFASDKLLRKRQHGKRANSQVATPRPPPGGKKLTLRPTMSTNSMENLPNCSASPEGLLGYLQVNLSYKVDSSREELARVKFGGHWRPLDCKPLVKVAILVPFRNRPKQLEVFLRHMIPIFQRQQLEFRIFVLEQIGTTQFNKGAIYNLGFDETLRYDDYDCYIFHDVDLLAEDDRNYYGCPESPLHMSVGIDKFKYKLPYKEIFGGIQAFKKEDYIKVNGYSNKYWGWGAEDDDLYKRVIDAKLDINRPDNETAKYVMYKADHYVAHSDQQLWEARNKGMLKYHPLNRVKEGLNTISLLNSRSEIKEEELFVHLLIDLTLVE